MKNKILTTILPLILSISYAHGTLYENAEDGRTTGWSVYDNSPSGATITNIFDATRKSKVIKLSGNHTDNEYKMGNYSKRSGAWNNTTDTLLQWSMKFSEDYTIYVMVSTENGGVKYLYYKAIDRNYKNSSGNIQHGLGTKSKNGEWQTFTRDLNADLQEFEPNNRITSIDGIMIRGSGEIDDIQTFNPEKKKVYENGEDKRTSGWSVYDNNPSGATIRNVYSTDRKNRVIKLNGNATNNGYRLGNYSNRGDAWNNTTDTVIQWSMKFSEDYTIYVMVSTENGGVENLYYKALDRNYQSNSGNIQHGLGTKSKNGTWQTFTRDLNADLQEFDPNNKITSIDGIMIRGSGEIDDIQTFGIEKSSEGGSKLKYPKSSHNIDARVTNNSTLYPDYLESERGAEFGNKITRITDNVSAREFNATYSKRAVWNSDGSLLRIAYRLYDGNSYQEIPLTKGKNRDQLHNAFGGADNNSFRWSKKDPNIFYGFNTSKQFFRGTIRDRNSVSLRGAVSIETLRTFSDYDFFAMGPGEGNLDYNDEFIAFAGLKNNILHAIIYNIKSNEFIEYPLPDISWEPENKNQEADDLDWLSVSPLGNYLLINGKIDDEHAFIKQYSINWGERRVNYMGILANTRGHGDMAIDDNGDQVYVQFSIYPNHDKRIEMFNLENQTATTLLSDNYGGGHISCRNYKRPGWCYLSTTGTKGNDRFYAEVFAVKLDGSGTVERFAQTHTGIIPNTETLRSSHGVVNPDGTKILFRSNWNNRRNYFVTEAW